MTCGHQNPLVPYDQKHRPIICGRPIGHTRWHKGRGRIWDTHPDHHLLSRFSFKYRKAN